MKLPRLVVEVGLVDMDYLVKLHLGPEYGPNNEDSGPYQDQVTPVECFPPNREVPGTSLNVDYCFLIEAHETSLIRKWKDLNRQLANEYYQRSCHEAVTM